MDYRMDQMENPPAVRRAEYKANKTVNAVLATVGTIGSQWIAEAADAATWVHGALLVAGGAVNAFLVYWTKNKPRF